MYSCLQLPIIQQTLQKEIKHYVNQENQLDSWFTHGILQSSLVCNFPNFHGKLTKSQFTISFNPQVFFKAKPHNPTTLCCDGEFLFLLSENGLEKFGTGLGGTVNGRIYLVNRKLSPPSKGTLIFAQVNFSLHLLLRNNSI